MSLQRIAVVFDNRLRPETTGLYVRRALGRLVSHVEHVLPEELNRLEPGRFDAFVCIDDGLRYDWPQRLRPAAWWAIDTHLDYARTLARARQVDVVFAAQRDGTERLLSDGISSAMWLPLACDPHLHQSTVQPPVWDVSFVGNLFPGARTELLQRLTQEFPLSFVGNAYFRDMARIYGCSRLGFNRSVLNDVNMRVFEALAGGPLLLTNDLTDNGQTELFQDGRHLATYSSVEELLEKALFYLAHEDIRRNVAAAGQAEVLARHTYGHRAAEILRVLEQSVTKTIVGGPKESAGFLKDPTYFEFARPEVLSLVPHEARCVLDVGCGSGRLGAALRQRQPCEVWGIERESIAASQAALRLDRVLTVNLESDDWSLPDGYFDCVICADVLEHLRHPEQILKRLKPALRPGGSIVLSLPNVQHHSVITGLLDGHFTYEPAGLLDEDHLRLFTRREIEKLLFRAGYRAMTWQAVPGPGWDEWERAGRPGEVRLGGLSITGLSPESAAGFFAYQYLVRAEPAVRPEDDLTSIVLVTYNQIDYTRQCMSSLRFRTDEPYELIVIDNGSTDGTTDYFRSQSDVTLIANPENRGFPAAANQGLRVARGRQILLLNNDTILTTGWLRRLLDALHSDPAIGLIGPVSNAVSGPQQVPVSYRDLSGLDGFAWDWGKEHHRQIMDLDRLVGFCLLLRREVLERIGELDERFGIGNFEDDDYCRRTRDAGFRTAVAVDSFVHHFGHRTFDASGVDLGALLRENERKYREKWDANAQRQVSPHSDSPRIAMSQRPRFRLAQASEGGLLLEATDRPRLSLCMIVRNNEETIRPCLESIRRWVDEMIILDTGSTDATPQICEELGAQVYHWAWRDDFSAARNESLRYATGDWIFWMDSDDTIPEDCGRQLRALADGNHSDQILGYVMQVHCPGPTDTDGHDVTVVDHVKLFRNRPDLRFEHRIHEQILPAIRRASGEVAFTDIHVVHSGADHSAVGRQRKLDRDFKLLQLDLQERPDHPFVLFNLGMTYADAQQYDEAVHYLMRCLQVSTPQESHVRKAYALLVSALYQQARFDEAFRRCQEGRGIYPDDKELLFRQAMLEHQRGHFSEAANAYHGVLSVPSERHFTSVDADLSGIKARHNLALVYEDQQRFDLARQQWQTILTQRPDYVPATLGIVECLLQLEQWQEAETSLAALRQRVVLVVDACRLLARFHERRGDLPKAIDELVQGLASHGDDAVLLRELARIFYAVGQYAEAASTLQRLLALAPNDTVARNNLDVVQREMTAAAHQSPDSD